MLKLNLKKHCQLRNVNRPVLYLQKQGFSYFKAYNLCNKRVDNISVYDMERLCTIFKCTPSDLFTWEPDENTKDAASHPLAALNKEDIAQKGLNIIGQLSYDQLREVGQLLAEKIKPKA